MKFTVCDNCPCLNQDNEYGSECNLGCDAQDRWFLEDGKEEYFVVATDCRLDRVAVKNGEGFVPEVRDMEPVPEQPQRCWPKTLTQVQMEINLRENTLANNIFERLQRAHVDDGVEWPRK